MGLVNWLKVYYIAHTYIAVGWGGGGGRTDGQLYLMNIAKMPQ